MANSLKTQLKLKNVVFTNNTFCCVLLVFISMDLIKCTSQSDALFCWKKNFRLLAIQELNFMAKL